MSIGRIDRNFFILYRKSEQELAERMFDNIVMQLGRLELMPFGYQKTDFCGDIRRMIIKTPPYLAYYVVVGMQVHILERNPKCADKIVMHTQNSVLRHG